MIESDEGEFYYMDEKEPIGLIELLTRFEIHRNPENTDPFGRKAFCDFFLEGSGHKRK